MPIITDTPSSGGPPFTINDLVSQVIFRVENRTQNQEQVIQWLIDSLIEISTNGEYRDDFVELEVLGPTYNLTAQQQEYNQELIMPVGDINAATLDIRLWQNPPQNTNWIKLRPSNYQRTDESSTAYSQPQRWYRFGENIGFYPIPDQAYQIQARSLRYHPINDDDLGATEILLPRDWNEILVWAASQRGFMALEEYEKAQQIHMNLYGDPTNPLRPGIIGGRIKKRANEQWRQQQQLRPTVRRMTYFRW